MIDNPISYCAVSQLVVDAYKLKKKDENSHLYWFADELNSIKSEIKNYYKKKQKYTCNYCYQKINVSHGGSWDTEHIVPRATHPQFMFEPKNLCVACKDCNLIKSDKKVLVNQKRKKYPTKSDDFLIVHPHLDEYKKHIQTLKKGFFRARSPKGAFTITCCNLLRFGYEYVNWDENISQKPEVLEMVNDLLETTEEDDVSLTIGKKNGSTKKIMTYEINGEVKTVE